MSRSVQLTTALAVALLLTMALSGCGGGGGGGGVRPPLPPPVVSLPPGHGLGAGEIVVAAGTSAEHGNVVVTCPTGGGACVVRVMADGTAEYDRTGGVPTVTAGYVGWDLPVGHGLGAGEIVVAAGATAEHGNVVVTCPTRGSACVVRVMADGTAEYARTGGIPTVTAAYAASALPLGHGLGAGEITVAAGESAERGNVVVTCPAGGGACVISVSADGTAEYARTGSVPTVMAAYAAWALPLGHGLGAGEIVVSAGESAEHGNVVVTCPDGGSACVISLSADGTAAYARTGGIPTFMFANRSYERNNPTAEDLLDHWNEPEQLRAALSLSAVAASDVGHRKDVLARLIRGAGGNSDETGTLLRNVRPEHIEIIGERTGITYGRWKGGPAGTLNIEFDWQFAPDFDDETRARMERAGNSWSWRIRDDFGMHEVRDGTVVRRRIFPGTETLSVTYDEDVTVDGILIVIMAPGDTGFSNAGYAKAELTSDDITPWLGALMLSSNHVHLTDLMAHEIGHVLGLMETPAPSVDRYTNRANQTFTGPESQRANGGQPVPFQWLDPDFNPVAPNTPGARVDYTHPGVCASIMAYCADSRETFRPAPIDFAMLDDIGYDILDADTASDPELYGYGAWGEYSAWGAGVERTIRYEGGQVVDATDTLRAAADAFGMAPGGSLAANMALQGAVTWSGSLIGVDLGQAMLPPVFGDAELEVELSTLRGTASFDDLTVHVGGVPSDFRARELEYDIGVAGNAFSDEDGHVRGGFFGPAHQEMAGVLDDRTADVNLIAGFGGRR